MHYLSDTYQNAQLLSASKVPAKIKAGWQWHKLVPGFSTTGGAGSYRRALVSPDGVVALVNDRAPGIDALDFLPELRVSHRLVALSVPYELRGDAFDMGAVWIAHKKTWACAPDRVEDFVQWIPGERAEFDLLEA